MNFVLYVLTLTHHNLYCIVLKFDLFYPPTNPKVNQESLFNPQGILDKPGIPFNLAVYLKTLFILVPI